MSHPLVEQQRRHWDGVAAGWGTWLEWTERNFAPLTNWLAAAAVVRPGVRVLDVACGAGYPALAAATLVRPGGHVTATDLSAAMIAVAARAAEARGLDNIEFAAAQAEDLPCEDGTFDSVTNIYGLMFSPDLPQTVREARRVLKPGGRFAVAVWGAIADSPFFDVITTVARRTLGLPAPPADGPGPFRLAASGALADALVAGGFPPPHVERLQMVFACESVDDYIAVFRDVAWRSRIAALDERDRALFRREVDEASKPYQVNSRLHLATQSICAVTSAPLQK